MEIYKVPARSNKSFYNGSMMACHWLIYDRLLLDEGLDKGLRAKQCLDRQSFDATKTAREAESEIMTRTNFPIFRYKYLRFGIKQIISRLL